MMRPISSSFSPFFSVTTSVVEMPSRFSRSSALLADVAQVGAAQRDQRVALERVELQVDLEVRHVAGQPLGERLVLRRCARRWC